MQMFENGFKSSLAMYVEQHPAGMLEYMGLQNPTQLSKWREFVTDNHLILQNNMIF